ncbi:hypothetical protein LguiA_000868 [Lonicera macranthoides]
MKKNQNQETVMGIPIISAANQSNILSPAHCIQYHITPSSNTSLKFTQGKADSVFGRMNKLGEMVDNLAKGIREHVRMGPKLTETMKGKLSLGARILKVGGVEKVFKHKFSVREGEKLLKASQCYLSTTAGPIAGLLFISTDKVAFCSERSIKFSTPTGELFRYHYKVLIPTKKIKSANESENVKKPSMKYMQIVTKDDFEFWFMGFLNYQQTFKYIQQATSQAQGLTPCEK